MGKFKLKATSSSNSHAIVVSFHGKWHEAIRAKSVSVVFRKKGPTRYVPTAMYMYVSAPVSAIVARASVESYRSASIEEALAYVSEGGISEEELRDYAAQPYSKRYDELLVYGLGQIQLAGSPIGLTTLMSEYDFWPSPSYIPLSVDGKKTLDDIGHFED